MIIMEYASHGSLLDYLRGKTKLETEERDEGCHYFEPENNRLENMLENIQLISFALQIARGMDHLAKMKV